MAITLGKQRMYPLHKEGWGAPTQIQFPVATGTAGVPGAGAVVASGQATVNNAYDGVGGGFMGLHESTFASGITANTLVPITLAIPGIFYVGTFATDLAAADIPCSTLTSGYRNAADGTVGFSVIADTADDAGTFRIICAPGRGDLGSASIRGNIIERAGVTYGAGQTLNTNTISNWGTVGDTNCRVIFVFNPISTLFGSQT